MFVYVGMGGVVECGIVVVELSNFSFVRVSRTSGLLRSSGRCRTSDLFPVVRSLGENRARDELRDFGEEGDGEVEIE